MSTGSGQDVSDRLDSLQVRIATLEGKLAASWVTYTPEEYDRHVKDQVKGELISFATKFLLAAVVFLAGAGYLFIQAATVEAYRKENERAVADLKQRYEDNIKQDRARYNWQRYHNYANNYIHLAEFYLASGISGDKKAEYMERGLSRAGTYFEDALGYDPRQGSTYWELGELYYSYPEDFGVPRLKNEAVAFDYYSQAARYYSEEEVGQGWKADAERMIGTILLARAERETTDASQAALRKQALEQLQMARDGYRSALAIRDDIKNAANLKKVEAILVEHQRR